MNVLFDAADLNSLLLRTETPFTKHLTPGTLFHSPPHQHIFCLAYSDILILHKETYANYRQQIQYMSSYAQMWIIDDQPCRQDGQMV